MIVIDGQGLVLGRVAAFAAKQALLGRVVRIVNAQHIVISGARRTTIAEWQHKKFVRGTPRKGPFYTKLPDRFVRRVIRGMLPYKVPHGKAAYARVLCYIGLPPEFKDAPRVDVPGASARKLPNLKQLTVQDLILELGGKRHD